MNRFCLALLVALCFAAPALASGEPPAPIPKSIPVQEAYALIQENKDNQGFILLDVRTPGEFASGHLAGAVNLDYNSPAFRESVAGLDRSLAYLVYCGSGRRSEGAAGIMRELGFTEVYNMLGGISAWMSEGFAVEAAQPSPGLELPEAAPAQP